MDIGTPLPNGKMDAMVYIANWWTERQSSDVVVYGNVDEIELFVNGKSIARQTPDNGPDTEYTSNNTDRYKGGNPFDGGNAKNLKHPPFTFKNVKWEKGELKAVGYYKGEKVVEQKTMTPEEHQTIKIRADKSGKEIDKNDVFFVYAELLDTNGALCVDAEAEIELQLNGDAEIVSPKTMKAEAGIAAFLIKTGNKKCRISFKAKDVKHDEIKGKLVVR
jgi:beta-galactosidase